MTRNEREKLKDLAAVLEDTVTLLAGADPEDAEAELGEANTMLTDVLYALMELVEGSQSNAT